MPASFRAKVKGGGSDGFINRSVKVSNSLEDDLLVIFVSVADNSNESVIVTDDHFDGHGTYSRIDTAAWLTSDQRVCMGSVHVRDHKLVGHDPEFTITAHTGPNAAGEIGVIAVQGMLRAGMNAIRSHGVRSGIGSGHVGTVNLYQPALAENMTIVGLVGQDLTTSPPVGWIERIEGHQDNPTVAMAIATRDNGFTESVIVWGAPTASTVFSTFGIELDGSAPTSSDDI